MADIVLNCSFEKLGLYTGVSHILVSIAWFTYELIRLLGDTIVSEYLFVALFCQNVAIFGVNSETLDTRH